MTEPNYITESNLSLAWSKAFLKVYHDPSAGATPLIVTASGFAGGVVEEQAAIRLKVDEALEDRKRISCKINSELIFPQSLWRRMSSLGRDEFYNRYRDEIYPRLRARDKRRNGKGTYFLRMIAWNMPNQDAPPTDPCNQLEHLIRLYTAGVARGQRPRMSAMQIACFDPLRDHTKAVRSIFPCLQQIGLSYGSQQTLSLNAYYPSQYVFDRGYGNYLGLANLGIFMAHEMGLRFDTLRCFIGSPQLGDIAKGSLKTLEAFLKDQLQDSTSEDVEPE